MATRRESVTGRNDGLRDGLWRLERSPPCPFRGCVVMGQDGEGQTRKDISRKFWKLPHGMYHRHLWADEE